MMWRGERTVATAAMARLMGLALAGGVSAAAGTWALDDQAASSTLVDDGTGAGSNHTGAHPHGHHHSHNRQHKEGHASKLVVIIFASCIIVAVALLVRGCCARRDVHRHPSLLNPALQGKSAWRVPVVFLGITWALTLTSVVGLAIDCALNPDDSALNGDLNVVALEALWGISPVTSALFTSALLRRPLSHLSLRPRGPLIMFGVYMLPLIAGALQYAITSLIKLTGVYATAFVARWRAAYAVPASWNDHLCVFLGFLCTFTFTSVWDPTVPPNDNWGNGSGFSGGSWVVEAVMEEVGWTGVLFPEIYKLTGRRFFRASVLTGLLWSAWHYCFIIDASYKYLPVGVDYETGLESTPLWYSLLMFTVCLVGLRVVLAWSYLASGSAWPAILGHASHNAMVVSYTAQLSLPRHHASKYFVGESGVFLSIIYWLLAAACTYRMHRWRDVAPAGVGCDGSLNGGGGGGEAAAGKAEAGKADVSEHRSDSASASASASVASATVGSAVGSTGAPGLRTRTSSRCSDEGASAGAASSVAAAVPAESRPRYGSIGGGDGGGELAMPKRASTTSAGKTYHRFVDDR